MKKIAYFGSDLILSGATLAMISLACDARKMGFEPIIIIPGGDAIIAKLEENNLKYYVVPSYTWVIAIQNNILKKIETSIKHCIKIFLNIFAIPKIRKILKKENIDIAHLNSIYTYVGFKAAKKEHIKTVWHIREFLEEDQNAKLYNKKYAFNMISKADKVIVISKSVGEKFSKYIDNSKITLVYDGLKIEDYINENHEIFQNEKINLLMPSNIQKGKGQEELIKALKIVKDKGLSNFKINFMGYGTEENVKFLMDCIKNNDLINEANYLGFVKNISDYFNKSDIVFMCSKSEAFGRTTVEAMLSGCLVIGASAGATKEILSNSTGVLYNLYDVEDLANKIISVISNIEKYRFIAKNGQKTAKEFYSSEKNCENIIKIYETI